MGQDGAVVAKDALGYSLGYYAGDYQPIGGSSANAFASTYQQALGDITGQNLYNGNIGNSTYSIGQINNGSSVGYTYKYDQLNRLKALRQHGLSGAGTWSTSSISDHYKEDFSYDGNGNILALLRNGSGGQAMDQLNYRYSRDKTGRLLNNKLGGLSDAVDSGQQGELAGNTSYSYDAIGNLIRDTKEGITGIDWSVYGKIKQINKAAGNIFYSYDPSGNRVAKLFNNKSTWYVRDAQGNSLAVYDNEGGHTNWKEQQLYGSSRLGMWKPEINLDSVGIINAAISTNLLGLTGNKNYELTNHLGNVMAVITDNRTQVGSEYEADVVNAQDYYAFGSQMPGRIFNLGGYRYGFNGKENDNEVKGTGNQQDYGMRIYDPRIGKFLSVDPLQKQYPELTPYQFASNTPIQAIDLDGLEKVHYTLTYSTSGTPTLTQGKTELTYSYMLFWSKKYEPTATIHYNGGTYNFRLNNNVGNQFDRDPLQNLGAEYDFNRLGEFLSNRGNADGNSGGRWFPSEERVGEHVLVNSLAAGTRAMAEHSGSLSLYKSFSNKQFQRANNGSSESEPILINLKYKEGWSIEQKVEAQLKVAALNTKQLVVTGVPKRQNNLRGRYEKANNTKLATDVDVDHTHDLQLGGADALNNTNGLNNSVNRSLGKQINNAIKNLPKGTKVDKVIIN